MDPPAKHREKSSAAEKTPSKPVDEKALAAMLRESALIVERGEFDPILYTALQDFRAYYKAHYPTTKKKSSTTPTNTRERSRSRTRDGKKGVSSSASVTSVDSSQPTIQVNGEVVGKPTSNKSLDGASPSTTTTDPISVETTTKPLSVEVPVATNKEPMDASVESAPTEVFETEPAAEPTIAHVPDVTGVAQAAPPGSPASNKFIRPKAVETASSPAAAHASPATIQKATANMIFGKLGMKFPKKIVPTAAFAATSKKNADRVKEDLEAFQGELAQQAESSRRRKGLGDTAAEWCEVHFTMNCGCHESTSPTQKNDPTSWPLSQSPRGGEHAPPLTAASTTSEHQTQQQQHVVPSPSSTQPPPPTFHVNNTGRGASLGDVSEAASSQATAESTAAVQESYKNNPFADHHDPAAPVAAGSTAAAASSISNSTTEEMSQGQASTTETVTRPAKPDFQKPANANSNLVANGWIEQQRRSKMRFVWKEVLASLVLGRKPGEETTLWIQREAINPVSQKKELEALHRIPVKLMESCSYLDYTPDNRFTLKVYNASEEFLFRCPTDSAAAKWVMTLQQHAQMTKGKTVPFGERAAAAYEEEKKGPENHEQIRMSVHELRAICHGAGINTAGMERTQLEAAAEEVRRRGTFFPTPTGAPQPIPFPYSAAPPPQQPQQRAQAAPEVVPPTQATSSNKLSISELRAICHGAGINTAGMERGQLERAAEEVQKRGTFFPPPNSSHPATAPHSGGSHSSPPPQPTHTAPPPTQPHSAPAEPTQERLSISELRAICHGAGIYTVGMERKQLEAAAEEVRKRGTYFDPPASSASTSSHPTSTASAPGDLQHEAAKRRETEEKARRAQEEYSRQKMEEEQRRRAAEQEHQRRMAEQQAAEQHRRYADQQAAWQKQQQEEEGRRRAAEQQAAEQRRRQEEATRKQQQWQQQQWHQQQQQQWNQQQWPPRQGHPQQQPQWQQQQQHAQPPSQQQRHQTPPPQQQHAHQQNAQHHSAASEKYAKMANQTESDGQAVITRIKHDILIHWALQPPQLQMLRPIDALVTSIHKVFPPALGVPAHDYFQKWKALNQGDVSNAAGLPDEERLKKAVRKIRFFLHPDKLPKDLNSEQSFMVKMLWDVTSDAWEEFEKRKADLDWIK